MSWPPSTETVRIPRIRELRSRSIHFLRRLPRSRIRRLHCTRIQIRPAGPHVRRIAGLGLEARVVRSSRSRRVRIAYLGLRFRHRFLRRFRRRFCHRVRRWLRHGLYLRIRNRHHRLRENIIHIIRRLRETRTTTAGIQTKIERKERADVPVEDRKTSGLVEEGPQHRFQRDLQILQVETILVPRVVAVEVPVVRLPVPTLKVNRIRTVRNSDPTTERSTGNGVECSSSQVGHYEERRRTRLEATCAVTLKGSRADPEQKSPNGSYRWRTTSKSVVSSQICTSDSC